MTNEGGRVEKGAVKKDEGKEGRRKGGNGGQTLEKLQLSSFWESRSCSGVSAEQGQFITTLTPLLRASPNWLCSTLPPFPLPNWVQMLL